MEYTGILNEDLAEDTIQCLFFSETPDQGAEYWESLCLKINKLIETIADSYLWHHDEFKVYFPLSDDFRSDAPPHLASTTYFGDNIEDEWFIVHIIFELSRHFDIIVQLKDADDNFLLIEAADYLPLWAKPETTCNRVFIYKNHIHLISPEIYKNPPTLKDAIRIIADNSEQTKASQEIHAAINNRIGSYPEKINETIHTAIVNIPLDIATLLRLKPKLISAFVNAYCHHDIIDAKACKNMSFENCVAVPVKFSKFMYAELLHSRLIKNNKHAHAAQNNKRSVLGFKLACGYHMIMNKSQCNIFESKEFHKFIDNLKRNCYFRENLEGSKEYTALFEKAKKFYSSVECPVNSSMHNKILQIMSSQDFTNVKQTLVNQNETNLKDDSDEWLNINPDQLNDFLNKQYGKDKKVTNVTEQSLASGLSSFLYQTSDFEGIEMKTEPETIDFDTDDFQKAIEKMLNIVSGGENVDDDSDFSYDSEDDPLEDPININSNDPLHNKINVLQNLVQSIKEEEGSTGPSSNLLRNIGIKKSDLLDSDDDN